MTRRFDPLALSRGSPATSRCAGAQPAAGLPSDPPRRGNCQQIFFGATVTYVNARGETRTITIKGVDESDSLAGEVSWVAPIARALLKARQGDEVRLATPAGVETIEVLTVQYPNPA